MKTLILAFFGFIFGGFLFQYFQDAPNYSDAAKIAFFQTAIVLYMYFIIKDKIEWKDKK